jgi:tetratricopeptide (TPR) repeat protein
MAIFAACVGLSLAAAPRARAQEDIELEARTQFAAGRYERALDIYASLYAKTLHPTYLRNIGRCFQSMGEPDKAINAFNDYLRKAPNASAADRAEVEGFIRDMEALKRSREAKGAAPPPAPAPAAPPPVVAPPAVGDALTADKPPAGVVISTPDQTAAETQASPFYTRWWFWSAVGAVVVGGVITAFVLSTGSDTPTHATDLGTRDINPR